MLILCSHLYGRALDHATRGNVFLALEFGVVEVGAVEFGAVELGAASSGLETLLI